MTPKQCKKNKGEVKQGGNTQVPREGRREDGQRYPKKNDVGITFKETSWLYGVAFHKKKRSYMTRA